MGDRIKKKNVSMGSLNGFCYTLKWLDKDSGQRVKPENTDVLLLPLWPIVTLKLVRQIWKLPESPERFQSTHKVRLLFQTICMGYFQMETWDKGQVNLCLRR